MFPRTPLPFLPLLLVACTANAPTPLITVSGTLVKAGGKYYLQSAETRYHLNWMPQLRYGKYLGRELVVRGSVPEQCAQAWEDAVIKVHGGAELVDWRAVDWSTCIAAERVSLVTEEGERLVYDWREINMEDYYF
ncbi:hypothetical protein [Microbulbifer sp.]|uniref:hypothetical protein n=1 Tax=Microbulbifer sp. TaxID=1908541 RepID=UPI003F2C5ABE